MIGPAYARAHPDRVRSVTLLSTAAGRTEEDRAKVRGVLASMEEEGIEARLGTLVERWYTDGFIAARPDAIETRKRQVLDTPAHVFLSVFHIYAETELVILDGLKHSILIEAPERVAAPVRDFLLRHR